MVIVAMKISSVAKNRRSVFSILLVISIASKPIHV